MNVNSVSSHYLATAMLPTINQTQSQLSKLEIESSTGQYADLGLQLGNQSGFELSLRNDDDLLQALTAANSLTSASLSTSQSALGALSTSAQSVMSQLLPLTNSVGNAATMQTLGQSNLQQLIAVANTTSAGNYVFGGQNESVAPLDDYFASPSSGAKAAVDNAFQSYFGFAVGSAQASTITSSQMQNFLSGPFAALFSGSSWTSDWSKASDDDVSTQIAPGQTVKTSTNTNTAAFQQLAEGYAMLSEFGNSGLSSDVQQTLASVALKVIGHGQSALTATQAQLGVSQNAISQANNYMSTQMTQLQTEIGGLDNINAAEVATQLSTLSTQLQSAYQLTAQIQKLSLAQYLPA